MHGRRDWDKSRRIFGGPINYVAVDFMEAEKWLERSYSFGKSVFGTDGLRGSAYRWHRASFYHCPQCHNTGGFPRLQSTGTRRDFQSAAC